MSLCCPCHRPDEYGHVSTCPYGRIAELERELALTCDALEDCNSACDKAADTIARYVQVYGVLPDRR